MDIEVKVYADKYADLLSMTDPAALEERLKSLLQSKNQFFGPDQATPGIEITNEENQDIMVAIQEGNLTNLQTQPLGQQNEKYLPFNVFDHGSSDNFKQTEHQA